MGKGQWARDKGLMGKGHWGQGATARARRKGQGEVVGKSQIKIQRSD